MEPELRVEIEMEMEMEMEMDLRPGTEPHHPSTAGERG